MTSSAMSFSRVGTPSPAQFCAPTRLTTRSPTPDSVTIRSGDLSLTDDTRGPPPARTLTDRTLSAMIWQFSSKLFEAVGRLAVMIILARLLNPHAFGVASAGLVIAGLATTLSQLGVAQALVQRRVLDTAHTSTAFIFAVASGAAAGLIMALLAEPISAFFGMPELHRVTQVIATSLPISAGAAVAEAALSRRLRFATISSIDALSFAVGYGATGILLAYSGYGLWSLIGAQLAYTALRSGALLLVNPEVLSWRFERNALQDLLRFGAGHSIAELGNFAALQGDNIVVGRYMGAVSLGLYERSYAFMAQPTRMIGLVFDLVLFPAMATVQDDSARLRRVLKPFARFHCHHDNSSEPGDGRVRRRSSSSSPWARSW